MVSLNDRFDIDPEQPLPQYDGPLSKAYAAKARSSNAAPCFALVCQTLLPLRIDLLTAQRAMTHASLMRVQDGGVIDWPFSGERHYVFVYDIPHGKRMTLSEDMTFPAIREDYVIDRIIKMLVPGLESLARAGVFHGSIRASNLFLIGDAASGGVVLGDNLAAPAAYGQPVAYETIERGLAPAIARGPGVMSDDLYAFGVTLLAALMGERPLKDASDETVIQFKMERGSYAALANERRFGGAITELLRGLLTDDPKQRWTLTDLDMWISGRRLTPKQSLAARRAVRTVRYNNQDFVQLRQLMTVFPVDTKLAAAFVRGQELARWISHGFSDEKILSSLEEAVNTARFQRAGNEDERMICNVMAALDPLGPIRYRGLSFMPAGMPTLLADLIIKEAPLQSLSEVLQNDAGDLWMSYQPEKRTDILATVQAMERAKEYVNKSGLGFGLERVLYDNNPGSPCLSPPLRRHYALTLRQLLEAIDKRASAGMSVDLVDRHIAAFILSRDRATLPQMMRAYETGKQDVEKSLALLTLYSEIQYRNGPDVLKGVAKLLLTPSEAIIRRFHSRPRREKLRKELKDASESGKLGAMLKLVDDPDLLVLDMDEYEAARILYAATEDEIKRLTATMNGRKTIAREAGEPFASAIAVGFGFIGLLITVLKMFM
jgi:hypothetical protein